MRSEDAQQKRFKLLQIGFFIEISMEIKLTCDKVGAVDVCESNEYSQYDRFGPNCGVGLLVRVDIPIGH